MQVHVVFWYKSRVLYFETSDGRKGATPASFSNYRELSRAVMAGLGISEDKGDTVEYL